jgi:hypothetical protein
MEKDRADSPSHDTERQPVRAERRTWLSGSKLDAARRRELVEVIRRARAS